MFRFLMMLVLLGLASAGAKGAVPADCSESAALRTSVRAELAREAGAAPDGVGDELAMALVQCLAAADPDVRDGLGYEGIAALMRGERVSSSGVAALYDRLAVRMAETDDPAGVEKPFIVLVLSEVARHDRLHASLGDERRSALVGLGNAYLGGLRDYRGFNDEEGWRHGVAHSADLLMQLSLNEAISPAEQAQMLGAIAAQVSPEGHSYVFGEPGRLARPVLFIARRDMLDDAAWDAFFADVTDFGDETARASVYKSEVSLARLHNVRDFLYALAVNLMETEEAPLVALRGRSVAAIRSLP